MRVDQVPIRWLLSRHSLFQSGLWRACSGALLAGYYSTYFEWIFKWSYTLLPRTNPQSQLKLYFN
jgi:hypothetical protein